MQKQVRLTRELAKMLNNPSEGVQLYRKDDDLRVLEAVIDGPKSTPYENGIFKLEVIVPDNYPFSAPSIRFITKIYHPNIDENGRICLDLIVLPPKGSWRPTLSIESILVAIRMLLESPNPDDPLMADIAEEFKKSNAEFTRKAKEYTTKYA